MSEELNPCPFCGRKPLYHDLHQRVKVYRCEGQGHRVECEGNTEEDTRIEWNCRAADERVRELGADRDRWKARAKRYEKWYGDLCGGRFGAIHPALKPEVKNEPE